MNCKWFTLLSRIVPFAWLRLRLCQWHIERCQRCQQESDSLETLPALLVTAGQLPPDLDLWPGVRAGINSPGALRKQKRRTWRWAYAAPMAVLLVAAGFWAVFHRRYLEPQPVPAVERPAVRTRVCSARIENRPARIFLIQSRNPDRTIFWIARNNTRS